MSAAMSGDSFIEGVESALGEGRHPGDTRTVLRDLANDVDRFMAQMEAEEGDTFYAIAAITYNGKRWALPWGITPFVLWYTPAAFDATGVEPPPDQGWDWEQFREITQQRAVPADADGSGGQWGFFGGGGTSLFLIWQNGGRLIADDGASSPLREPAAVEALRYLRELVHEYKSVPPNTAVETKVVSDGKFQILVSGSPLATVFGQAVLPAGISLEALGVRLAPMIHGRESVTLGGANGMLSVMTGTQDAGAAFFVARQVAAKVGDRSPYPARRNAAAEDVPKKWGLTEYEAKAVLSAMDTARGLTHPKSDDAFHILRDKVETPVVEKNADPEIACSDAADEIELKLAEE